MRSTPTQRTHVPRMVEFRAFCITGDVDRRVNDIHEVLRHLSSNLEGWSQRGAYDNIPWGRYKQASYIRSSSLGRSVWHRATYLR